MHLLRLPAQPGRTVDIDAQLPDLLRQRLALAGITTLWTHQAQMLDHVHAGQHAILTTGTASGKSLAYQLPLIEQLLNDEQASALYLSPTKALAHDQLRALRAFKLPQIRAAVIDGDTPTAERDAIRRTANVLLTNPDLLHHSLLADHRRWATFLSRLRFVIVDEAHTARGVFGGHVALVLRRLRRIAGRYRANPTWMLASATVGNPSAHASALTGLDVTAITEDGSPRGPLDIGIWQPGTDEHGRRSSLAESGRLLAGFIASDVQTLVFARSRKAVETIALIARERLEGQRGANGADLADAVAAYRGGYLADERRDLEQRLRDGQLRGLAATSALELGIDVSGLDAVVLCGWPGTIASFWQRVGRAGRSADAAVAVLVADDDPLDQYIATHPTALENTDTEHALVDPANPHLLVGHLRCASQEAPLTDDDAADLFGPTAPSLLHADVAAGVLRRRQEQHYWVGRQRASEAVSLRSASTRQVRIVDRATGALIGDVDEPRAHWQVHPGAVYLHQGRQLVVAELDLDSGIALVEEPAALAVRTRPRSDTDIDVVDVLDTTAQRHVTTFLGRVKVTSQVTGYDVLALGSDEIVDRIALSLPPVELDTVAVWYCLADSTLRSINISPSATPGTLHAAEHAAIGMLPLLALCDRWDIGGVSTAHHPHTQAPTVFIYDGYPGGIGLAERAYQQFDNHQRVTLDRVQACTCANGCPSCIHSPKCGNGNEPLDKRGAIKLLRMLAHAQA